MKKLTAVILTALLAFSVAACSSESSSSEQAEGPKDSGTLGEYEVAIKDCEVTQDYDGKDAVVITYEFTNNGDDAASFDVAMMTKVFQDGVELEYTSVYIDEESLEAVDDDCMKSIKPGNSLEVKTARVLDNTSSPVEVEVEEFLGNGDKLTKTFEIAE